MSGDFLMCVLAVVGVFALVFPVMTGRLDRWWDDDKRDPNFYGRRPPKRGRKR